MMKSAAVRTPTGFSIEFRVVRRGRQLTNSCARLGWALGGRNCVLVRQVLPYEDADNFHLAQSEE